MLGRFMPFFFAALLVGCQDASPVGPNPPANAEAITPDCYEGCLETDPDPEAPGYFVAGQMYSYEGCTDVDYDVDQDGLDDYCEILLAQFFAPSMSFLYGDDVSRDMRWAARADDGVVIIAYLLGYYLDNGSDLCFGTAGKCAGHQGDSEWVSLSVTYNATSHHWEMVAATFSKHESPTTYWQYGGSLVPRSYFFAQSIQFPDVFLGYPTVLASDGKHANYATDSECDSGEGGWVPNTDECKTPRYTERFDAGYAGNIGSRQHPFLDCVQTTNSAHPAYALHATECYWTVKPFEGWFFSYPDAETSSYSDILTFLGF